MPVAKIETATVRGPELPSTEIPRSHYPGTSPADSFSVCLSVGKALWVGWDARARPAVKELGEALEA